MREDAKVLRTLLESLQQEEAARLAGCAHRRGEGIEPFLGLSGSVSSGSMFIAVAAGWRTGAAGGLSRRIASVPARMKPCHLEAP